MDLFPAEMFCRNLVDNVVLLWGKVVSMHVSSLLNLGLKFYAEPTYDWILPNIYCDFCFHAFEKVNVMGRFSHLE